MKVILIRGRAIDPAVNKIAKSLSQNGHEVKLLVWDRQNTLKIKNNEGYEINRFNFKASYDKLTSVFYYPIWWIYIFFFLMREKYDVIHACDLDTLLPAIIVKIIKKKKLCYTIYDFYANNLPDGQFSFMRKAVRSLVASVEKFGIEFTEVLFLVDESRYEQVKSAKINKVVYIYNSPPDYLDTKYKQNSSDRVEIVIFYAGAIHRSRGIEHMIKAIEYLNNVKLIIAGTGPHKDLLENLTQKTKDRIEPMGWIPYEEVIANSLNADILFAFYDPQIPANRYASPNKLFEAMMCGKPIITNAETTATKIVETENCGVVVPYGDVEAIKDTILKLKNNADLRERLGKNGRRAYEERYGWGIMEERLLKAYANLIDN
ncbi:MAG: glycosyltransferase family 4 protein [Methanosarcinales archaeon]|jgi:glycosyltransferase involved in cell wall biosynthesis|nr:glycosyltransferase family 4 protein [Methanosarcinales archaeon]